MWAIFVKGGPVMIPLAVLSVLGVAVTIEKLISLRHSRVIQREIVNTMLGSLNSFQNGAEIEDDITLVLIKITG